MNSPGHPLIEGLIGRGQATREGCQSTAEHHTPWDAPWRDTPREDEKTLLFKYVRNAPEGTPLSKIVQDVFGDESGSYSNTDYQLARRFYERHDMFLIARRSGNLWVEPTPDVFHLNRSKHPSKTQGCGGENLLPAEIREKYAKDRARSYLAKHTQIGSDGIRGDLLNELATELESIADVWNLFERIPSSNKRWPSLICFLSTSSIESNRHHYG